MGNNVGKPFFYVLVGLFGVFFLYNGIKMFSAGDKPEQTQPLGTYVSNTHTLVGGLATKRHKRNKGNKSKRK
jgi:hypothetical protein